MSRNAMVWRTRIVIESSPAPARDGVSFGPTHARVTVIETTTMPTMTPIGYPKA